MKMKTKGKWGRTYTEELPTTNCGKLPKEFNLKEKRKELLNTCRGNSDSLRIINEVEKQDIEFIRLLKEEISKGHTEVGFEKEIDKLSGGL